MSGERHDGRPPGPRGMASTLTDEELMGAYGGGSQEAFDEIFARYAGLLLRVARRQMENEEQARDIVQETLVRLHVARHDFRRDARLRPWLLTIEMNLIRGHWRQTKRRKTFADDTLDTRAGPPVEPYTGDAKRRATLLRNALETLPESQRTVVELHWLEERPFAEVAQIVGASEGAVRVRAHRAYKKLRELLPTDTIDD